MNIAPEIYRILKDYPGYMSVKDLARRLNMTDRELRGRDGDPGILARASEEILRDTGCVLLRSMANRGVKLSRDLSEIAAVKTEWNKQHWNTKRIVDALDEAEKILMKNHEQLSLKLS